MNSRIIDINIGSIAPEIDAIMVDQGLTGGQPVSKTLLGLLDWSLEILTSVAEPRCLMGQLSLDDFENIFDGEGQNDPQAPLAKIYPKAASLALFTLTLGETVSRHISELTENNDFAEAYMLDLVASSAADKAVSFIEANYGDAIGLRKADQPSIHVLAYSPGYCGWHITAQKKLFAALEPEKIGVNLNVGCLMIPLKSVSGVLVAGTADIHRFHPNFGFCRMCRTHACHKRLKELGKQPQ